MIHSREAIDDTLAHLKNFPTVRAVFHCFTGTLAEASELIDLARAGKIAPIQTRERPLGEAQAALDDLRAGRVVGRTVLTVS